MQKTYVTHNGKDIKRVLRCEPKHASANLRLGDLIIMVDYAVSPDKHCIKDGQIVEKTLEDIGAENSGRQLEKEERIRSHLLAKAEIIGTVNEKYPGIIELLVGLELVNPLIIELIKE